jgi:hypothetical protein
MTLSDLAALGKRMRDAQNAYFKNRDSRDLNRSRAIEREFDKVVEEVLHPKPKLFEEA